MAKGVHNRFHHHLQSSNFHILLQVSDTCSCEPPLI
jgi:hypothetical protein